MPFSKDGRSFLSIYDGTTRYRLDETIYDPNGGFFVHVSEQAAASSMRSFPRHSAAWAVWGCPVASYSCSNCKKKNMTIWMGIGESVFI